MVLICRVKAAKQKVLPSITHVDGTARLQTVDKTLNPRFHALISEFKRLTGVPVVINTSFNVKGQPIVNTPEEAIETFLTTGIDHLFLEGRCLTKR